MNSLFLELRNRTCMVRLVQLFLPLLILSFFLSCHYDSCLEFFIQVHSVKHHFNKKAIFCFFNAILLFLAKDSGLFISYHQKTEMRNRCRAEPSVDWKEEERPLSASQAAEPAKVEISVTLEVAVVEEVVAEDEADIVGEMEELSIVELNRKFDEFIEKIKREREDEELQLVTVQ